MPGVRKGIAWDLPRRRLALKQHWSLATRLAAERYGSALVMPRTWKSRWRRSSPAFPSGPALPARPASAC